MVKYFKKYAGNVAGLILILVILLDIDFQNLQPFDILILVLSIISGALNIASAFMKK